MIFYLQANPDPGAVSGGTRKLNDHVAILQAHGFDARIITNEQVMADPHRLGPDDVIIVAEVYGDGMRDFIPSGWRRISFVQNSYLIDLVNNDVITKDPHAQHAFMTTPELEAIFTESQHTEDRLRERFPNLPVPLIRTHSSGNGRLGKDAGFHYGEWPRRKEIVYFGYKHEALNSQLFNGLDLPAGWTTRCLTGMTDQEIVDTLAAVAIFASTNFHEGMCAPTSEAMISGCVNVCWTGGGPDEYLIGRAVIAKQNDMAELRRLLVETCHAIDTNPDLWADQTREWSEWFQATYSRDGEIDELVRIFTDLGFQRSGPKVNVGCGEHYTPGWVNLDTDPREGVQPDLLVDPADPFATFDPQSVSKVYLGHLLEHIPWGHVPDFLAQVRKVLEPGGQVCAVGPDVYRAINRYKHGAEPEWLMQITLEGDHYQMPAGDPGTHKWNCHEARLVWALENAGFADVVAIPPPAQHTEQGAVPGWPVTHYAPWQCGAQGRNP